jgi:hypothetical protein
MKKYAIFDGGLGFETRSAKSLTQDVLPLKYIGILWM